MDKSFRHFLEEAAKKPAQQETAEVGDRLGFEKWARAEQYDLTRSTGKGGWGRAGDYKETTTQAAWEGWRAAKGYKEAVKDVDVSSIVVTVEHEEEGDGEWVNDMFNVLIDGQEFAYSNGFIDKGKVPYNWSIFSVDDKVAAQIANSIDFSDLKKAKSPKQATDLIKRQVSAWIKTPQGKKVIEHFLKWNESGTYATRLKSL